MLTVYRAEHVHCNAPARAGLPFSSKGSVPGVYCHGTLSGAPDECREYDDYPKFGAGGPCPNRVPYSTEICAVTAENYLSWWYSPALLWVSELRVLVQQRAHIWSRAGWSLVRYDVGPSAYHQDTRQVLISPRSPQCTRFGPVGWLDPVT